MRKGLTVTLLSVAVAILGSNAMAIAPTISGIKDIVVANDAPVTAANLFVYPDAINLNTVVSDTDTVDADLIWSYAESTDTYIINAVPSLDVGTESDVTPPAGKIIAGPGATTGDDPDAVDSDLFTITVRNAALSPIGGPNVDPAQSGILSSETRTLTFFVSDSDLSSSETISVYTEADGQDHLSPGGAGGVPILDRDFTTSDHGWKFEQTVGTIVSSQGATGLCLTTPAAGDHFAKWVSPYGDVELVDNAVYEFRFTMNSTQTTDGAQPLWAFAVINGNTVDSNGFGTNSYGGNFYALDNVGSAMAVGKFRSEFVAFFTPPQVQLPSWRSTTQGGAFEPAIDDFNDMQMSFYLFDMVTNSGWGGQNDSGAICLQTLSVNRYDLGTLNRLSTVYSDSDLTNPDLATTESFGATTFTFSGGNLTIAPVNASSWNATQDFIRPGEGSNDGGSGPLPVADWPIPWDADKLYLIEAEFSSPNATAQSNGTPDLFMIQLEGGGQQLFHQSYALPNIKLNGAAVGGGAAPVAPATGTYLAFGHTNEDSKASFYDALRPVIMFQNIPGIGNPDVPSGSITMHGWSVDEVTF